MANLRYAIRSMAANGYLDERIYALHLGQRGPEAETASWVNRGERRHGPFKSHNYLGVGSGFPRDVPAPILAFDKPMPPDGDLFDAYQIDFIWAVNHSLKATFDALDPRAFNYLKASTRFEDVSAGPDYWLTDVVQFIDCHDAERSLAAHPKAMLKSTADFTFDGHVFRADALSHALFFRIPQSLEWLSTARAKASVERAGHDQIFFSEVGWAR